MNFNILIEKGFVMFPWQLFAIFLIILLILKLQLKILEKKKAIRII